MQIRPQLLSRRVLSDLKKRATIGIFFYIIAVSICIFYGGYYQRHPSFSNEFLVLISGICLFRFVHMALDRHLPQTPFNTTVFMSSVILTALIWGIGYAKFTLQQEEFYIQHLMGTCTIGFCAGGVVACIPCLWLAWGINACIMLPATVTLIFLGNYPLGLLFILFFLFMIFIAYSQNDEYWNTLDNEYLLKKKTDVLRELSTQDCLTGLYNRRYFDQTFFREWKRALRNKTSITVLMCDIDHFKKINDKYGHIAGDEYLIMIAEILQKVFRRDTDIVSRYGGEEFVVLLMEEKIETLEKLGQEVISLVENTIVEFKNQLIRTTISIGLAQIVPEPGMQREELISFADQALYTAKANGRNQFYIDLPLKIKDRQSITPDIKQTIPDKAE